MNYEELPKLSGSEKQIEWATKIRGKAILAYSDQAWDIIKSIRSSKIWIEHREDLSELLQLSDECPRMLTNEELENLDISRYTKAELHDMWLIDRAVYRHNVEIPWNFLLGVDVE